MKENLIAQTATLLDALVRLNKLPGGTMTLFAIDDEGRLTGALTDGDIRRAIIAGRSLDDTVAVAMHRDFTALRAADRANAVGLLRECCERGLRMIPCLDHEDKIVEIIDLNRTHTRLPLSAILMAGGKGERLRPLTLDCPKPLLEIDGKAIIDYNVEALAACGVTDITVTTRYLADMISCHFAEPVAGVRVKCVREDKPLGTIGAVTLADIPAEGRTLIMNSDLLTTISFEEMYLRHAERQADITIAVVPYQVSVPFAILTLDGEDVTGIEEKPSYSHYANAGIYIFENKILRNLPADRHIDAPQVIADTIAAGGRVAYYPIKGTWIDVGSPADFRQAAELMRHHRNLSHSKS